MHVASGTHPCSQDNLIFEWTSRLKQSGALIMGVDMRLFLPQLRTELLALRRILCRISNLPLREAHVHPLFTGSYHAGWVQGFELRIQGALWDPSSTPNCGNHLSPFHTSKDPPPPLPPKKKRHPLQDTFKHLFRNVISIFVILIPI